MKHNIIETLIGGVVLIVAGVFLFFAYSKSTISPSLNMPKAIAKFDRIDGLVLGSEVRMSGVKIGVVEDIKIDPKTFLAVITLNYDKKLKLPIDTSAEIVSNGLLGNKYISLVPGAEEEILKKGDEISHTQSSVNLEALIGQAIFSKKSE